MQTFSCYEKHVRPSADIVVDICKRYQLRQPCQHCFELNLRFQQYICLAGRGCVIALGVATGYPDVTMPRKNMTNLQQGVLGRSFLCQSFTPYSRGRQQADRGPDPDLGADLYGPGPIINTLIGDFKCDDSILTAADRGRKRRVSDTGRETQKKRRESGREESE